MSNFYKNPILILKPKPYSDLVFSYLFRQYLIFSRKILFGRLLSELYEFCRHYKKQRELHFHVPGR